MSNTAEERVLFLVLSEDEESAKNMLRDFLPTELKSLEDTLNTLLDLIEEIRDHEI